MNTKYFNLQNEYNELKELSEESKNELSRAMMEMEGYSELLMTLESKVKEAELAKKNAEIERDKAVNDVKTIRQRYIDIMGEN